MSYGVVRPPRALQTRLISGPSARRPSSGSAAFLGLMKHGSNAKDAKTIMKLDTLRTQAVLAGYSGDLGLFRLQEFDLVDTALL